MTNHSQSSISFRLCGRDHCISLSHFAKLLDIYPSDSARRAQLDYFMEGEDTQKNEVWIEITGQPFHDPHRCKASSILDPKVKILHRILTATFLGRVESIANVSVRDLTLLYCFLC